MIKGYAFIDMCGIFCSISPRSEDVEISDEWHTCKDFITARGPDKLAQNFIPLNEIWFGHFAASILWMQGLKLVEQPLIDSDGNILLWNGDVFSGPLAKADTCDGITILNTFGTCSEIINVLRNIQGPYSFVYFQKSTKLLYFGRDTIGRHSLLLKLNNEQNMLTLTSVGGKCLKNIVEVPAVGTFVINLSESDINLACYPWQEPDFRFKDIIEELKSNLHVNINIKNTSEFDVSNKPIMYLNPSVKDLEYLENNPYHEDFNKTIEYLLQNEVVCGRVEHLSKLLHDAVKVRIKTKPNYCKNCIQLVLKGENITCKHAKIGILFSGGLDSAILTLIAHKYVPKTETIDLINVAFEKTINISEKNNRNNTNLILPISQAYDTPDRKTGRQTLSELLVICPDREWNFIEINVTQAELQKYRSSRIGDLLYPLCTILDESLGCALWFASRAKGIISETDLEYESPCRVLLLGMGADELFGGYMRHRTILKRKGWNDFRQELNIELARISERNLGRDDRIVSDHGRQSRLPYLDQNLIKYVQQLKPWERCYPTDKMPPGLGDKLLLRLLARKLGFQKTATFPKRAFQFGSRIANSKENANDISKRL